MSNETEEFKLADLFGNVALSESLNIPFRPSVLQLTPQEMYDQIKQIALARFGHQLPEQKKLASLQSTLSKASLLRDICQTIGVQLKAQTYLLSNNIKQVVSHINEQTEKAVQATT